jgi:hypothetical protein
MAPPRAWVAWVIWICECLVVAGAHGPPRHSSSQTRRQSMCFMKEPTALSIVPSPQSSPVRAAFLRTRDYLSAQIIGQEVLVEGLLVALLADGHLLVEGPPGLAKTRAIKALARALEKHKVVLGQRQSRGLMGDDPFRLVP